MSVEHYYDIVRRHLERRGLWPKVSRKASVIRRAIRLILETLPEDFDPEKLDWGALFEDITEFETADDFVNDLIDRGKIPVKPEIMLERRYSELEQELTEIEMTARGLIDYLKEHGIDEGAREAIEELWHRAEEAIRRERELLPSEAERRRLRRTVDRLKKQLERLREEVARRPPTPPPPKPPPPPRKAYYHVTGMAREAPPHMISRLLILLERETGIPISLDSAISRVFKLPADDPDVRGLLERGALEESVLTPQEAEKLRKELASFLRRWGVPTRRWLPLIDQALRRVSYRRPYDEVKREAQVVLEELARKELEALGAAGAAGVARRRPAVTVTEELAGLMEGERLLLMLHPHLKGWIRDLWEMSSPHYVLDRTTPPKLLPWELRRSADAIDRWLREHGWWGLRWLLKNLVRDREINLNTFKRYGLEHLWEKYDLADPEDEVR